MDGQDGDLSNEAAALADILKWSADLPAWQRDALRRLCIQPKLESADITTLVGICKATEQGTPLDASHVRDPAASHAAVSLHALHGLSHVNALAPGERLSFGKTGLTVIYGDNGAGKSGYARVLKQLCRARSPKTMIAEVRQQGWSRSIELLRSGQMAPSLANEIVALIEDRRAFWARFDAEFPDRVRMSLDGLRHDLTRLRRNCAPGSSLDIVIVALAQTIRRFFDAVERFDLTTLRCDSRDPDWITFESALRSLRKSIGFQIATLAESYSIPLQGEFAAYVPLVSDYGDALGGRCSPG